MERHNEKKSKKVMGILCAVGVIAAFTTAANAESYSTDSYHSAAHTVGDNRTYFQKVEYHVGSTAPFDDAYIYTESGATPYHFRKTYYFFAGLGNFKKGCSMFGSGIQSISDGRTYAGHDYARGNCYAQLYSGPTEDTTCTHITYLTVN